MVLTLGLCAAIGYGLSDFLGGVLTRRASVWAVATASQGTAALLTVGLVATRVGAPSATALWWGALAGLGSAAGNVMIYQGLAVGRMGVVAPLSAVVSAALPVVVGLAGGDRPGTIALAGVAAAIPAIWLVTASSRDVERATRRDLLLGIGAGVGFGVQFAALGQVPESAGLTPLAVSQVVSVLAIVVAAVLSSAQWVPRTRHARFGAGAGALAGLATISFQLAAQVGPLTIAAVVTSLYPAVTVVLAALVFREAFHRAQGLGLAIAAAAIVMIALG